MDTKLPSAQGEDVAGVAAAEKQQLLSRLLARLAHEIRNPLSSLDIHMQLLEEDLELEAPVLRRKFSTRLGIIHNELHRLENVVKQFLRLAGPSALELETVDIREVLRHVSELVQPELDQRKIEIVTKIHPSPALMADPGQLTQALLNLVINALQAMDGGGKIELSAKAVEGYLQVSVRDNGPGIPADKMGAIFEPYFTTKSDGNGLGLWIAQQIALAHNGDLHVANVPAGGAVFILKLPFKRKDTVNG